MFTIIYRWRIKPQMERQFIENWAEVTEYYLKNADGAFGSRLHKGNDGFWYAYAQWKSDADRQKAFCNAPDFPVREKMKEAIEESFPEIRLEIIADFLKSAQNS